MNEHLFKLKKDGKTVGYERFVYCDQREGYLKSKSLVPQHSVNSISWEHIYEWVLNTSPKGYWFNALLDMDVYIEHDEKCPFVTKDKNGKDVFAGDEMQSKDRLRKYEVVWNERQCNWFLRGLSTSWAVNEPTWKDYELIEDKENE